MEIDALLEGARAGTFPPCVVLVGDESFLASRAVDALRKAVVGDGPRGFNEDLFEGRGAKAATVVSAAQTLPMMASARLVLLRRVDQMSPTDQASMGEYLASPSESTCLLMTAEKLDGRGKLAKAAKKSKAWVDVRPLKHGALRSFAQNEARARGHALLGNGVEALLDALGEDLAAIDDALERLSLFVGPGVAIDAEAVHACVTRVRADSIWLLVDAVGLKERDKALEAASSLLADRQPPLRILAMLARQLRMVARMRQALAEGLRGAEAAKQAGAPPFKAGELGRAAQRFRLADLGRAFETLAEVDMALKGSRRPPETILQEGILRLTHR
ncbi:MAG: DNA polymerase III subunit delta [Myxococcales bacterium]|nr:DNA polymerase III subunit delta [Myxococcales bacterium]